MPVSNAIPLAPLTERLQSLGFPLPEPAVAGLAAYLGLLMKWNMAMNLVGASSWQEALDSLAADSFHLAAFLPELGLPPEPVTWDLGAGAGLPGIPLRLVWRAGSYTLVEAREKRALFMRTVLSSVDLGDTSVFHGRAEALFRGAGPADLIVSRAFMPWRGMLYFIKNSLAPNGKVVFLTLSPMPDDLPLGWCKVGEKSYTAAGTRRYFWCLAKTGAIEP